MKPKMLNNVLQSVTTNDEGFYIFNDIPPGDYIVQPEDTNYLYSPPYYEVTISNSDIEDRSFLCTLDTTSFGIQDPGESMSFEIFPNPATEYLTLSMHQLARNEPLEIELVSTTGTVMYKQNIRVASRDHKMRINVENISTGIYFISIRYNNSTLSRKVIIR